MLFMTISDQSGPDQGSLHCIVPANPIKKEHQKKNDVAANPVKKEPEQQEPVQKRGLPDGESTKIQSSTEDEPEPPKDGVNQLPVVQALEYSTVAKMDGEVNVSISTDIYVFGQNSKPPPFKLPSCVSTVRLLEPISQAAKDSSKDGHKAHWLGKSTSLSQSVLGLWVVNVMKQIPMTRTTNRQGTEALAV